MKLKINGAMEEISGEITINELLVEKNVESSDMVSVELNGEILSKSNFNTLRVKDGDEVEFLYFMGGGSN